MISLVAPLYLLGMLLIAIPVILHLLRNRPDHAERFPSLFFSSTMCFPVSPSTE